MEPLFVVVGASGLLLSIAFIVLCSFVVLSLENDSPGWATFTITIVGLVIWFFTDFSYRYHIQSNITWRGILISALAYIAVGVLWSMFKWYLELSERRERYDEIVKQYREAYDVEKQIPVNPVNDRRFVQYVKDKHAFSGFVDKKTFNESGWMIRVRPKPNKPRITGWMIYWPWSLLWSIFDDFITGIFRWVYRQLSGTYEAMANYMFRDIPE